MAVIDPMAQLEIIADDGKAERMCVFILKGVSAGDTINVGGYFRLVKRAVALSSTDVHSGSITTIAGTTVTIPAGPLNDAIYVMIIGVSI